MAYAITPPEMTAILRMENMEYKIIVTKVDRMSSCDRMTEVNISGFFDNEWKNEKETAPVMAAPKRKKPQRIRNTAAQKRVKPKHKYPLLYKNSRNTDWGKLGCEERFVDLGNHEYINTKELKRAFNELTKNLKAAETDALQKAADDVMERAKKMKCLW